MGGWTEWWGGTLEGRCVQWRVVDSGQTNPLNTYRPVLPRITSQRKTYLLSLRHGLNEIVIYDSKKKTEIKKHKISEDFFHQIQFMWCTYNQLFLITYSNSIYMMNFTKDLKDFQLDCSFEIAECFGLDMPSQR